MMVSIFLRVVAYALDAVIIGMLIGLASFSLCMLGIVTFGATWGIMGLVLFIIPFACHSILIGGSDSATFGMRLMNMEVKNWMVDRPNTFRLRFKPFFLRINRLNRLVNFSDRFFFGFQRVPSRFFFWYSYH